MQKIAILAGWVALSATILIASPTRAAFHLWKIDEIFSNSDGSVQFIEMLDPSNFETQLSGMTIRSNSTGKTFTFPMNLSDTLTANHHLLIATAGFGALAGGVTPDFTLPSTKFFNPAGDTLSFAGGTDAKRFGSVPRDGILSRIYPSDTLATNSPTNFAGMSGSVNLVAEPATMTLACVGLLLVVLRRYAR